MLLLSGQAGSAEALFIGTIYLLGAGDGAADALTSVQALLAGLQTGKPLPLATGLFGLAEHLSRHVLLDAKGEVIKDPNLQHSELRPI